ncbi:MAG: VIT1/CCC1 transporter family protein [Patescibacteria group bacterium]
MRFLDTKGALYLRNLVFGVEDGIVSTVGLLSGIAIAGVPRPTIFLTGIVLIFVEAVSMAAGSFLSEASVDEVSGMHDTPRQSLSAGVIMFASYFVAGFIPLLPYVLLLDVGYALPVSIAAAFCTLFLLGYWSGRNSHAAWRKALRMVLVGGTAILVGTFAGSIVA